MEVCPVRSGPAWLPIVIALVLATAVTGARYYHRDANQKLRAAPRILDDRAEFATAFMNRLPRDRSPLREAGLPAKSEEADALLQLYHLLSLDGLQSRLLFGLLAPDAPEWGPDTVMSYARWTMLSRLRFELERGRFEAVRLLGQRFINLVNVMGPADYFLLLDGDLQTSRRVVQVTTGRYLYDDEAMSRRVLRALIAETVAIPAAGTESVELVLGDDIAYANARARAARSARYTEKRVIWEEFLASQGESRRRPEAAFNVIDATMNAFRDIPSKDPNHLARARADSRQALDLCRDFVRQYPDSYLTDDALRYLLRLAFSLGESDQVLDAYIRLAVYRDRRMHSSGRSTASCVGSSTRTRHPPARLERPATGLPSKHDDHRPRLSVAQVPCWNGSRDCWTRPIPRLSEGRAPTRCWAAS